MSESLKFFSLAVIVPCYNEEKRLPRTLEIITQWRQRRALPLEINFFFVDDASQDKTPVILQNAEAKGLLTFIPMSANMGKGAATQKGILFALKQRDFDAVLYMDADISTDLDHLLDVCNLFREQTQAQVIIGARMSADTKRSPLRKILTKIFSMYIQCRFHLNLHDTQCGFKAFRAPAARLLFESLHSPGYAFDVEILLRARKLSLPVQELPIRWQEVRGSKVRLIRDGLRLIWDVEQLLKGQYS